MANIKDVAKRAGLSTATVSHVLNNTRKVHPETRERVLAAVRELRYTQNANARTLVTGRSGLVGLLISDIRNPFFPDLAAAFQEQGLLHEIDALVMNTDFEPQRTLNCVKRLLRLQVPGIVFMTSQVDPFVEGLLAEHEICAVYLDLGHVGHLISNIVIDYEHGIMQALDHLRSLGHRRIGFIVGSAQFLSVARRRDAFIESVGKSNEMETCSISVESDFTMRGGYVACSKLLTRFTPTAILAVNDLTAIGAMHCAHDRRFKVPEDLSIVGFDDIALAEFANPALTTVRIPRSEIGSLAFRALWKIMHDPDRKGSSHVVDTSLVVRESSAPPKGD